MAKRRCTKTLQNFKLLYQRIVVLFGDPQFKNFTKLQLSVSSIRYLFLQYYIVTGTVLTLLNDQLVHVDNKRTSYGFIYFLWQGFNQIAFVKCVDCCNVFNSPYVICSFKSNVATTLQRCGAKKNISNNKISNNTSNNKNISAIT